MAIYRQVQMSFWNDAKIVDDFTPEDKYFYLYLLTNPHTNLAGCYELSMKQASDETGYNKETIEKIIKRMQEKHGVIAYDKKTKEILVLHWSRYNWINSDKFRKPLMKNIQSVKNDNFREVLLKKYNGEDTVSIPYQYGIDTTVTVTDTDTVTDTVTDSVADAKSGKPKKHRHGTYQHVLLTDKELQTLVSEYGERETAEAIRHLDEYIEEKGYKSKSHYLAMRRWVFDAVVERKHKKSEKESRIDWIDAAVHDITGGGI